MKTKLFVRQSLFFAAVLISVTLGLRLPGGAENLPSIDARQLEITPKEISRSGRVYRFKAGGELPRTGNLILIQIKDRPIMAFRVLKTDSSSNELIAKRVRRYDREGSLELDRKYTAAEKIADLVTPPEPEVAPSQATPPGAAPLAAAIPTAPVPGAKAAPVPGATAAPVPGATAATAPVVKTAPLPTPPSEAPVSSPSTPSAPTAMSSPPPEEAPVEAEPRDPNAPALLGDDGTGGPRDETPIVAGSVERYDEELDASTSPRDQPESEHIAEMGQARDKKGTGVEEHEPLIQYPHMIGLSVGSFRNMSGFVLPESGNNGVTVYYNEVIDREIWFKEHAPQDSLSLEFGLGYYSLANYLSATDGYDLLPIRTELLYTLQFNPSFAFISHLGAQFNWVISAQDASELGISQLQGLQPNAGIGILYHIGPQWYLRADAGIDRFAIGLAVKW